MGTETNSSLYFQSSALPTELPGQGMRKRVLNSRARSESSPKRRFRDSGAIIPGSSRADLEKCDVKGPGNDAKADPQEFGTGVSYVPTADPRSMEVRGKLRPTPVFRCAEKPTHLATALTAESRLIYYARSCTYPAY
jgi:hypothetical protein